MQKHVNLVDLVKSFPTNIYLQNLASIQKRTSPVKFAHLAEKSGKGSISNLSTKALAPDPPGPEAALEPVKAKKKAKKKKAARPGDNDDAFLEDAMRQAEQEKEKLEAEMTAQEQRQKQKDDVVKQFVSRRRPAWNEKESMNRSKTKWTGAAWTGQLGP